MVHERQSSHSRRPRFCIPFAGETLPLPPPVSTFAPSRGCTCCRQAAAAATAGSHAEGKSHLHEGFSGHTSQVDFDDLPRSYDIVPPVVSPRKLRRPRDRRRHSPANRLRAYTGKRLAASRRGKRQNRTRVKFHSRVAAKISSVRVQFSSLRDLQSLRSI